MRSGQRRDDRIGVLVAAPRIAAAAACWLVLGSAVGIAEGKTATPTATVDVGSHPIAVTIHSRLGRRSMVEAECVIPASKDTVWKVLTDYEHLNEIVPFLTESRIIGQADGGKILRQTGRGGLWIFQRRFTVTFRVEEQPGASITFKAVEGDFRQFDGFWRIEERPDGTLVRHQVTVEPAFYMPKWAVSVVAKYLMMKSLEGVIHRCVDESRAAL